MSLTARSSRPYQIVEEDGEAGVILNWHAGQRQAWESDARFVVVTAGVQSGKTVMGVHWLVREISLTADPTGYENDYIAATATYRLFTRKMLPALLEVIEHVYQIGRYWAGDQIVELRDPATGKFWAKRASDPMWGRILLGAANAAGGLESATARAAWCDEWGMDEVDNQAQDAIESRLAIKQGRQFVTTTAYNIGLLKVRFHDPWKGGDPDIDFINFESIANPTFPREEFERQRAILPAWRFDMRYRGLLTKPAGLIYSDYDDSYCDLTPVMEDIPGEFGVVKETRLARFDKTGSGHLVRPFTIPAYWMRTLGIDFGPVNEARLWLAEEPQTGYYYAYRERLGGGLSGPEYAREALEYKEPLRGVWGGAKSEAERRREWQMAGLPVAEPVITDVEAGIDHVTGLLRQHRIFVFDTLTGLRSELGTYSREVDDAGEPTHKIADKQKFHILDSLRAGAGAWPIDAPAPAKLDLPPPPGRTPALIKAREAWYNKGQRAQKGSEEY